MNDFNTRIEQRTSEARSASDGEGYRENGEHAREENRFFCEGRRIEGSEESVSNAGKCIGCRVVRERREEAAEKPFSLLHVRVIVGIAVYAFNWDRVGEMSGEAGIDNRRRACMQGLTDTLGRS